MSEKSRRIEIASILQQAHTESSFRRGIFVDDLIDRENRLLIFHVAIAVLGTLIFCAGIYCLICLTFLKTHHSESVYVENHIPPQGLMRKIGDRTIVVYDSTGVHDVDTSGFVTAYYRNKLVDTLMVIPIKDGAIMSAGGSKDSLSTPTHGSDDLEKRAKLQKRVEKLEHRVKILENRPQFLFLTDTLVLPWKIDPRLYNAGTRMSLDTAEKMNSIGIHDFGGVSTWILGRRYDSLVDVLERSDTIAYKILSDTSYQIQQKRRKNR